MLFRPAENLCSSCNKTESRAPTKNLRLDPEIEVCKYCGNACNATAHKWAHFREAGRREFFISDDLLRILYVFPWLGWPWRHCTIDMGQLSGSVSYGDC